MACIEMIKLTGFTKMTLSRQTHPCEEFETV